MKSIAVRLLPEEDLRGRIEEVAQGHRIRAGVVLSGVGSLSTLRVRLAEDQEKVWRGSFEIVSITGTISPDGPHLHISAADESGDVLGGHLKGGCKVLTTCELVIGILEDASFSRVNDAATGYPELMIE